MENKKEKILKNLEPMFKEAKEKGLWFYCNYQDLWFSPSELRKAQSEGRFIWGEKNWRLRNPEELIKLHKSAVKNHNKEIELVRKRISGEKELNIC
jgi:hypothetical protein